MKRLATLIVALNVAFLFAIWAPALAQTTETAESVTLDNSFFYESIMQQANETEPQPVTLYMYSSADNGELKPMLPSNTTGNSARPAQYGGANLPGGIGWYVGEWTSPKATAAMTIATTVNGAFWAVGTGQDVTIYVYIDHNDNEIGREGTDTKSVNGDTEFLLSTTISAVDMAVGDTISIRIYAGSRVGSNFEVAWGSSQHNSHITITCNPMLVTINQPLVSEHNVVFSASIQDAFVSTALIANLKVTNHGDILSISEPRFSQGEENGTTVSWDWDYKTDKARNGEYTVTVVLSYSEENEFTAMGSYILEFPGGGEGDGGILGGLGWLIPLIIVVVIIAVIFVVVKVVLARRSSKSAV